MLNTMVYASDIDKEDQERWSRIVDMANNAQDSLLLATAPEAMDWFKHHQRWEHYYSTWDSKANVYLYSDRVQTALHEAQLMLDDANSHDNNIGRAMAYQLMGVIYESIGQHEQAIEVFHKCIVQLHDANPDSEMLNNVYDYLCQTYDENHDYHGALATIGMWERYIKEREQRENMSLQTKRTSYLIFHCDKALALSGMKRYDEAEQQLKLAEQAQQYEKTTLGQYRIYYARARHALAKGDPEQSLMYCDSLDAMSIDAGGETQTMRADIMMLQGYYRQAAEMFRKLYVNKDSVFSRDMRIQLDELNTLYKVEELKMQGELQRSRFTIGIIVVVVVLLLLLIALSHRSSRKLRIEHELLKEANAKAEESSKMKTNFIHQISHEIRTPLNVLSGFTQVITMPGVKLDDATKQDINLRITENTRRITELVNRMLELSDASSRTVIEQMDDVTPSLLAVMAVEQAGLTSMKDITLEQHIAADVANIVLHTNQEQAVKVLVLLLDNAQKFLTGRQSVPTGTQRGIVRLAVSADAHMVSFVVEDTGIGIPASEADHIFEEFVQLDDYYNGTGIGLSVARSIARRIGGDVVLDTTYTAGARFVFTLPLRKWQER
jgi:signal transduction histidine kinase